MTTHRTHTYRALAGGWRAWCDCGWASALHQSIDAVMTDVARHSANDVHERNTST